MRKRLLSLVLVVAFAMSLFVVTAGATSFKDDKDITNKDAVEKMASLNIINGRDTGNFDPKGIVTRAEMCKMITVALNGGNDPKLDSKSVVTSSFTDTKGHWAEGYIEYCVNMGIVAGMGNKTFAPDQTVTASQASKMLLVAIGYDAAFEKFTGTTWAINTNKIAMQKGLYDEIQNIDPNAPMTRDAAAAMVNNFCDAAMVKYEFGVTGTGTAVTGVKQAVDINLSTATAKPVYQTVLNKYYKLITVKGTMTNMTYDKAKQEYGYRIQDPLAVPALDKTFYSKNDYSKLFGMKVELLYKDKNKNDAYDRSDDTIYNITADESKLVAEGYLGDFSNSSFTARKELKFGGKYYDVDVTTAAGANSDDKDTIPAYYIVTGGEAGTKKGAANFKGYFGTGSNLLAGLSEKGAQVRLLDVDGNGKVDKMIVIPFNVKKVTYVGSDNATVSGTIGNNKLADMTTYTGMAKDDRVVTIDSTYALTGMPTLTKATVATGKITATKGTNDYKVGDTWLTKVDGDTISINDTIEYVAYGDEIFWCKVTEPGTTSKEVAVVVKVGTTNGSGADSAKPEAQLMFTDGTKKTVIISKINGFDAVIGNDVKNGAIAKTNNALDERVGELVTYVKDSDNYYELTDLATPGVTPSTVPGTSMVNFAGFDGTGSTAVYKNKTVGGYTLADDAVVFVVKKSTDGTVKDNEVKTYTGKELKNSYESATWPTVGTNGWETYGTAALYKEVNGFNYAKVAVINAKEFPDVNSSSNYGYLVGDVEKVYVNSKNYLGFPVWDGKETKTVYQETTNATLAALTKGSVIGYDFDGTVSINTGVTSTLVKNVLVPGLVTDAITGWDDSKTTGDIAFATGNVTSKVDSDTVVIFVDSKNKTAPAKDATYAIAKASDSNGDNVINAGDANARYLVSGTSLKLLVVDISDKMKAAPVVGSASVTAAAIDTNTKLTAAFATANTLTVTTDVYKPTTNITVPAGKTLIVKSMDTTGVTVGLEDGTATLNVTGELLAAANTVTANTAGSVKVTGAGTVNVTGAIGTVTANDATGTINAGSTIATVTANAGTINANGNIGTVTSNAGTIKVLASLTIDTLTANAGSITVAGGTTLTVTKAAPAAALEKITGVAVGAILDVKAQSSDTTANVDRNNAATKLAKFWDGVGVAAGAAGDVAVALNGGKVAADVYTWKVVNYDADGTTVSDTTVNAWSAS